MVETREARVTTRIRIAIEIGDVTAGIAIIITTGIMTAAATAHREDTTTTEAEAADVTVIKE